ncbi:MAG: TIGR00341 family protein [bacterium]
MEGNSEPKGGAVRSVLFVHAEEARSLNQDVARVAPHITLTTVDILEFSSNPDRFLDNVDHLVVAAPLAGVKRVFEIAIDKQLGVGVLPIKGDKSLRKYFRLPDNLDDQILLGIEANRLARDVIYCNGKMVLFKATIGRLPLIDNVDGDSRWRAIRRIFTRFKNIRLLAMNFRTAGGKEIETAASGCAIVQHHEGSAAASMIAGDSDSRDGMISLLVSSPSSVLDYFVFLYQVIFRRPVKAKLPNTLGYIRSPVIDISAEQQLNVSIDGVKETQLPIRCEVAPMTLKVNTGSSAQDRVAKTKTTERVDIQNLPIGSETEKARKKKIPFFPYASEERFKDLFSALREDARLNGAYIVLMILSTVLATVGLYQNSTSVVIGAMLLAPLMAPIISLSMGMLRRDPFLYTQSAYKVLAGIAIALSAAVGITMMFPNTPVTDEMLGRLSPSLLDLAVAIFAGVAGAYTKSFKEILQSLAGVAIAVALVPPLAVAGIGLGRGDPYFFAQAFLLFSTNLIGIILAAILTFRVLGYSAAIKGKRSFIYVALILGLITIPLYLTYEDIIEDIRFEQAWKRERFLVNGKYVIVRSAKRYEAHNRDIVTMKILAREQLNRNDLDVFKEKIQRNFSKRMVIRAEINYIL